jgi:hypothetical protein
MIGQWADLSVSRRKQVTDFFEWGSVLSDFFKNLGNSELAKKRKYCCL